MVLQLWYDLVNLILPFNWAGHLFMKNALLALILVSPIFGILGTIIVNNKMAFFSDAIGHSTLTGIAIGVLLGLHNPLSAMIGFSLFLAVSIAMVKQVSLNSSDTIIGVFSSGAIALGIMVLSIGGGFSKYSSYLIGDILNITGTDILVLLIILILVSGYSCLIKCF